MRYLVVALVALLCVASLSFSEGQKELHGVWFGEYHESEFVLVLFPTGDYRLEMYDRVVRFGRWSAGPREVPSELVLRPGIFTDTETVRYWIDWLKEDTLCVGIQDGQMCVPIQRHRQAEH